MATPGPWHIDIRAWQSWVSTQGTWTRQNDAGMSGGGFVYNSSQAAGDNIGWDVPLTAGTWTITFLNWSWGVVASDTAAMLKLGSTTVGTYDLYSINARDHLNQASGVVVAADGIQRVSLVTSAAKIIRPQHITLSRTA